MLDKFGINIKQQQRNILQDLVNLLYSVPRYVQDIRDHLPAFE